jgi:hypothetical protein
LCIVVVTLLQSGLTTQRAGQETRPLQPQRDAAVRCSARLCENSDLVILEKEKVVQISPSPKIEMRKNENVSIDFLSLRARSEFSHSLAHG